MYLYKELSFKIIGLCMKIHNEYGNHHNEKIYHNLLTEILDLNKIEFKSEPKISVYSKITGKKIGLYIPDLLINNKILLEIKAQNFHQKKFEVQLSEYLKITPYEVAYLVNFGLPSLYFKRIIYTNDRKNFLSIPKSESVSSV